MSVSVIRAVTKTVPVFLCVALLNGILSYFLVPVLSPERTVPWHITIDTACLMVALFAFLVGWMAYDRKVPRVGYLGFGFLLVALFDFSQLLTFTDGIVFPASGLAAWFLLLGRIVEALVLLGAVSGLRHTVPRGKLLLLIVGLFGLSLLAAFSFPAVASLSAQSSPYMTAAWSAFLYACYGATVVLAFRMLRRGELNVFTGLGGAALCLALAQTCLIFAGGRTDFWLMMGHHFKLCGYGFVLWLLISEAVVAPFRRLEQRSAALEQEVQERRSAQQNLAATNERLNSILSNNPAVVYDATVAKDGRYMRVDFVSSNVSSILGYGARELQELIKEPGSFFDGIHPKDLPRVRNRMSHLIKRGYVQGDFRFRRRDGSYLWMHLKARRLGDCGKNEVRVVGCITDLSGRKRIENALRRAEHDRKLILSTIPDKVIYFDLNMRMIWANAACSGQDGKSVLAGKNCYQVWFARDEPCPECPILATLRTGTFQEKEITKPDGSVWFVRSHPVRDDDGNLIGAVKVSTDITERKKMEEELQRSQRQIVHIFESITDGFLALDKHWRITYINMEAARITGLKPEALIGKNVCDLLPERGAAICEMLRTAAEERRTVSFEAVIDDGWWEIRVYPSSDGLAVYLRDISERKRAQEQYIKLERLNVIGEMAAGIAHEVRNPMTSARGFLQILEEKAECRLYKSYFELVISEIDRANEIISEYLSLARNRPVNKRPGNLNRIIETILPLIRADGVTRDKYVQTDLGNIPELILDDKEIRQLILNLARNGLEAMDAGGVLTIATVLDDEDVVLVVRDQGRGIPPEILDKLGTPFLTTKKAGTGLGLAVCQSIADRHNAVIAVGTGPEGTTFFVRFATGNKSSGGRETENRILRVVNP